MKNGLLITLILTIALQASAKGTYTIDASNAMRLPEKGHLQMGNPGPEDKKIEINNLYMTIAGKPVLPVMGEMHFNRTKRDQWEDCILKMKACGINVISTYLFWNHHEEIEGQFNWNGDLDIRAFIELCQKHGMLVYPRIGPWSHGEGRNGGTPDWILHKKYLTDRSNDPVYQTYVARYFKEIAEQFQGLYYKDGGNIIGIQLENEYWYAKKGEPHIQWLKDTAKKLGMDVPMYTVTGWGGGSVPPYEVVPLWGGYADEPWVEKVTKDTLAYNFMFDSFRDNKHIGNDQIDHKEQYMTYEEYPFFTCEMGVGVPMMYHRRITVSSIDGLGMMLAKLGSGSNLLGYYVFAGGTHPRGALHGTEEEQEETGYWCRVPAKSYDFQGAIKESGELASSYRQVKKLHYFVNETAEQLAPMMPVLAKTSENDLQYAVRADEHSAYLFGINYCRYVPKVIRKDIQFEVKLKNETVHFPQKGIDIPDSTVFIWPVNLSLDKVLLKYATAQFLCKTEDAYIFFRNKTIRPEFAFDDSNIDQVSTSKGQVITKNGLIIADELYPGKDCTINIKLKDGSSRKILLLTEQDADNAWLFNRNGHKEFYISSSGMYENENNLYLYSTNNQMQVSQWKDGKFTDSNLSAPKKEESIRLTPHPLFSDAQWLESADFSNLPDYMKHYHRFFFKEFSLENPSDFRKATLYIYPESNCQLNINDQWVRQEMKPGQLNAIDITGYVHKKDNLLFIDFPYIEALKKFTARIIVEYRNYDRIEFSTDSSWLTTDMYTTPSTMKPYNRPVAPIIATSPDNAKSIFSSGFGEWDITIPYGSQNGLKALYSHIKYIGDRAELYNGYQLCDDDFNTNLPWQIGLQRLQPSAEGQTLRLVVYPLSKDTKLFFDNPSRPQDYDKASVEKFEVIPEYKLKL